MTFRDEIAALEHEQWAGWMRYLFQKSVLNDDGTVTIPKWAVDRWKRQMNTPYSVLSTDEKRIDLVEADKVIRIMKTHRITIEVSNV